MRHLGSCLLLTLLSVALLFGAEAGAAGLEGAEVTVTGYCCTAPTEANRFTVPATATVGAGVEFPAGSLLTIGRDLITSNVDLAAFSIELVYTASATAAGGSFNGFAFDFTGLGAQRIALASLNPQSSFAPGSVGLFFDADSLFYDAAGLVFVPGSRVLIDIELAPVPLPGAGVLLGGGLLMLGARRRARADV